MNCDRLNYHNGAPISSPHQNGVILSRIQRKLTELKQLPWAATTLQSCSKTKIMKTEILMSEQEIEKQSGNLESFRGSENGRRLNL